MLWPGWVGNQDPIRLDVMMQRLPHALTRSFSVSIADAHRRRRFNRRWTPPPAYPDSLQDVV